jgi:hypothetical protein
VVLLETGWVADRKKGDNEITTTVERKMKTG